MTPTEAAAVAPAADFWGQLFVFVLATFIGLGVIRRVSRLLHTPLMSLTNAISAIAVVGSIIVTGARLPARDPPPRRDRAVRLDDQHRQRLPDHRPDAEDVQDGRRRGEAAHDLLASSSSPTSSRRRSSSSSLHWMNDPATARQGRVRRRRGHGARDRRDLGPARRSSTTAGSCWRSSRASSVGVPLSRVPLTAVPQRTALSHAFGGLAAGLVGTAKYYLWLRRGPGEPHGVPDDRASSSRSSSGFLTFTGSLMAAGKLQEVKWIPQRPVTYPLQNVINLGAASASPSALGVRAGRCTRRRRGRRMRLPGHHRAGAALRRAADHPDRRRRHADRHLDPQLLRRPLGGGDGLRARQQAADHRRRARRLERPDPVRSSCARR